MCVFGKVEGVRGRGVSQLCTGATFTIRRFICLDSNLSLELITQISSRQNCKAISCEYMNNVR